MLTGPALIMDQTFEAGEDLSAFQYGPLVFNTAGKVIKPTVDLALGERKAGFLMNKPKNAETALVRMLGIVPVTIEMLTFRSIKKNDPGVLYKSGATIRMATGRVSLEDVSSATAPVLDYPAVPGSIVFKDNAGGDLTFTAYNAITRTGTIANGDTTNDKVSYDIEAPVWGFFLEDGNADGDILAFFANVLADHFTYVSNHLS